MRKLIIFSVPVFGIGILTSSFLDFGWELGLFFLFLGMIFAALNVFSLPRIKKNQLRDARVFLFLAVIFFAFGAGVLRHEIKDKKNSSPFLEFRGDSLKGIVVEEPDERENYTRLVFAVKESYSDDNWNEAGGRILITTNRYPAYHYGDFLELSGVIKRPKDADQGDQNFSWRSYLAKDDIFFETFYPDLKKVADGRGSWLRQQLFGLKEKFLFNLSKTVPEPHASFLGGITVGARRSMPANLQENFRRTGVTHLVVLSGYNITLVADGIARFFNLLSAPRFFSAGFGVLGIVLFALMTGASATVVRASIMAILVIVARSTGRIYQMTSALLIAGFLMVLQNPKILRFDVSFQLSFLSTLALIYLSPIIEKFLNFIPQKFKIREFTAATVSTQIFVLPFVLYYMGTFSAVSLPTNILILVFIPLTMFFGFLAGIAGFFSFILSTFFSWIVYGLLAYELWVVEIFAQLPFAFFAISNFPFWLMILIYAGYAIIIYKLKRRHEDAI